jgi:hypothetical protein
MIRSRLALLAPGVVLALGLPVMAGVPFAGPAGAAITNGCSFGQYPNVPGGQSQLQVNCTFTNAGSGSSETVEDFPQAVWHNGAAWHLADGVTTSGSPVVTSASGHFNAATDLNHTVAGPSSILGLIPIPANSFIIAVNSPTSITLNHNATASKTAVSLTIANSSTRSVADGVTTLNSTNISSASADFLPADVGRIVTGTNIPGYDTIASVTSTTAAVLTTKATASGTLQTFTIGANEQTSTTREVTDAIVTAGSTTLSSNSANFQASDAQLPVIGCGVPTGDYIASVTNPTTAVLNAAATLTRPFVVSDGVTTLNSTTVTSASAGFSAACDTDKGITGTGIPAGAYISKVTNGTTVTISAKATANGSGVTLTETPGATEVIGLPSATAPANGDAVSTIGTTLTLNPTLVKGAAPCSAGQPSGETIEGGWYNPGGYLANTLALAPADLPTDTIGQILYPTSVVSFAGYVVNEAASTPGELDTAAHTDVILPFVPTSLALCATPALGIGSSFAFNGSTIAQQKVATGLGTPGTADVRGIVPLGSGVSTTTGTAYLINGKGSSPYSNSCTTNFPAAVTDVPCS